MKVLVLGAGICGLGTALLLGRDGHEVTVIDRDADPVPESPQAAWERWDRKGVAQFRQPHNFMPGLREILESDLPDVQESLAAAGASKFDLLHPLPPALADKSPRPIDDKLWTLTARRPVGEWVFAKAVETTPAVTIRRGAQATQLLTGPSSSRDTGTFLDDALFPVNRRSNCVSFLWRVVYDFGALARILARGPTATDATTPTIGAHYDRPTPGAIPGSGQVLFKGRRQGARRARRGTRVTRGAVAQ